MKKLRFNLQDDKRIYLLIIYDILSNRKRIKLAKLLEGYGERVQLSAFELLVEADEYRELLAKAEKIIGKEDSFRIYSLSKLPITEDRIIGTDVYIA